MTASAATDSLVSLAAREKRGGRLSTVAVLVALQMSMNRVLGVFGAWAILSGLLQLGTAIRRWRSFGAQWAMVLSGGRQSLSGCVVSPTARRIAAAPDRPVEPRVALGRLAARFGMGPRPEQTVYEYAAALADVVPPVRSDLSTVARAKVEVA